MNRPSRFLVLTSLFGCCVTAAAQQKPQYLGGTPALQAPQQAASNAPGIRAGSPEDLLRKQTAAIVELSQKIDRLERRVAELEAKRDK
jgi:hypothetical protein